MRWQERAQFFAIVAKIMRRILIEHARARGSAKRGGGVRPINLNEALLISSKLDPEIVRLDEALDQLAKFDSRKAQVVEMRYFRWPHIQGDRIGSWCFATEREPGLEPGQGVAGPCDESGGIRWTPSAGQ